MLAIVIPYFKRLFFEETLASLSRQTDKRFKVYIGDDASHEDPASVLEQFKGHFDFHYHRFDHNLGSISLVKQWNRCIELIQNESWIVVLGDDDVLGDQVVASFYKNVPAIEANATVVRFSTLKIDENSREISQQYTHPKLELATDFLFRETRTSLSELIFHRDELLSIGFKDLPLAWFSDVLAILECSHFKSVYTINEAVVKVRISSHSISGKSDNLKLKSKATFEFYNYLLTQKKTEFSKDQIEILLERISKCYVYNKDQFALFWSISKLYIRNASFNGYFIFITSIFSNFLKKF